MKSISKFIFILIFVGVLLKMIKTYYYQNNMELINTQEVFDWHFKASFIGNMLLTFSSVLSFLFYKKYFPKYIILCYLLIIMLVILTSVNDLNVIIKNPAIFYSPKGIGTYLNFGLLFFAANEHFNKILKLFYWISFVFIIAGVINLGKIGLGSSREQYLFAIRDFTVYLIWVFPFFFLQYEEDNRKNLLNLFTFLIIFIFVLSTGSRSYLFIYLIYFFVKFKNQLKSKNAVIIISATLLILVTGILLFSDSGLGKIIEGALKILSERSSEDSRSSQLIEFLDQYDLNFLFQGVGPISVWYWSVVGPYPFLDNLFLFLCWWAGLPTLMVYLFFLIKPLTQKAEILFFEDIKGLKLIIVLWILACAGLAIYAGISPDLYYDFFTLLMGLQTCKYTLLAQLDDEEQA